MTLFETLRCTNLLIKGQKVRDITSQNLSLLDFVFILPDTITLTHQNIDVYILKASFDYIVPKIVEIKHSISPSLASAIFTLITMKHQCNETLKH